MKISSMRFMDRYIGAFIIRSMFIPKGLRWLFLWWRRNEGNSRKVNSILVTKYFGMGSILNALPLLSELRQHFPCARIIFLSFENNRDFLEIINVADEVLTIRSTTFLSFGVDCLKAISKVRKEKVDVCIDLEFFSKFSMIMSYLSGAEKRVGFFSYFNVRSSLLTHPTAFNHYKHISRAYLAMAESLGVKVNSHDYRLNLPSKHADHGARLSEMIGNQDGSRFITINPNASKLCEMRKWPAERFIQLIRLLLEKFPEYRYVFIGSTREREYVQGILDQCDDPEKRVFNLAGKTDINLLLVLLENTYLFISKVGS